jgi:hypothetical protein
LIWAMIDNYLIHAPIKKKWCEAFSEFMDYMVRLGFICQKVKTSPQNKYKNFVACCLTLPEYRLSRYQKKKCLEVKPRWNLLWF